MKVFVHYVPTAQWGLRNWAVIVPQLRKLPDWTVLTVGTDSPAAIRAAATHPSTTLVAVVTGRLANKIMDRFIGEVVARKVAVMDDVNRANVWTSFRSEQYDAVVGAGAMTDPVFLEALARYWPPGKMFDVAFIANGVPYEAPFVSDAPRSPKVLFPSRTFRRDLYPFRQTWRDHLKDNPDVEFLTSRASLFGKAFVEHIGAFAACLVVVPSEGYLVAKLFETVLAGAVLLVSFPPTPFGDVARRQWGAMGFVDGEHYVEVTPGTFGDVARRAIDGELRSMAAKAHAFALANHMTVPHRLAEFLEFTRPKTPRAPAALGR